MSRIITTSEPAYRPPLSQWQQERMRGEIHDAPLPDHVWRDIRQDRIQYGLTMAIVLVVTLFGVWAWVR